MGRVGVWLGTLVLLSVVSASACWAQGWTVYNWYVYDDHDKNTVGGGGYTINPGYCSAEATGTPKPNNTWVNIWSRKVYHTTQVPYPDYPTTTSSDKLTGRASGAGYAYSGGDYTISNQRTTSYANPYNLTLDTGGVASQPASQQWYFAEVNTWAKADAYWFTGDSGSAYADSALTVSP